MCGCEFRQVDFVETTGDVYVTINGDVYKYLRGKIKELQRIKHGGSRSVHLARGTFATIEQIVWATFVTHKREPHLRFVHIDGNRDNCALANLRPKEKVSDSELVSNMERHTDRYLKQFKMSKRILCAAYTKEPYVTEEMVEDAIQDAFIYISSLQKAKDYNLNGYLTKIAERKITDKFRTSDYTKRTNETPEYAEWNEDISDPGYYDMERKVENKDIRCLLLSSMPEQDARMYQMWADGYEEEEIADEMRMSPKSCHTRMETIFDRVRYKLKLIRDEVL